MTKKIQGRILLEFCAIGEVCCEIARIKIAVFVLSYLFCLLRTPSRNLGTITLGKCGQVSATMLAIKMIPKTVLDECRENAQEALSRDKPRNWVAAGVIIAIWLLLIVLAIVVVTRTIEG